MFEANDKKRKISHTPANISDSKKDRNLQKLSVAADLCRNPYEYQVKLETIIILLCQQYY